MSSEIKYYADINAEKSIVKSKSGLALGTIADINAIPEPSEETKNLSFLYVGPRTENFVTNRIYTVKAEEGGYSWRDTSIIPNLDRDRVVITGEEGDLTVSTVTPDKLLYLSDMTGPDSIATSLDKKVDKTTTVNGHKLSANINLDKEDIGLGLVENKAPMDLPASTDTLNKLKEKVDKTQTVNNKPLSGDVMIGIADIPELETKLEAKADTAGLTEEFKKYIPKTISDKFVKDIELDATSSKVDIRANQVLTAGGTATNTITIPNSSDNQAGLMVPNQYKMIERHEVDIASLKGQSIRYAVRLGKGNIDPSDTQLTAKYREVSGNQGNPLDNTTLVDLDNDLEYTWFETDSTWAHRGSTVVNRATNDTLGIVKGSLDEDKVSVDVSDGTLKVNGHAKIVSDISSVDLKISNHILNKSNPHEVTKADVGLGLVENKAPMDLPASTDTLNKLKEKVDKTTTVNDHRLDADVVITKSDVGLGDVQNYSPKDMPLSDATTAALADKLNAKWGVENNGKYLKVNESGDIIPSATPDTEWGGINGTLTNQEDLKTALDGKLNAVGGVTTYNSDYQSKQVRNVTYSDALPSELEGSDGDIWVMPGDVEKGVKVETLTTESTLLMDNTIYRADQLGSISFTLPTQDMTSIFDVELDVSAGDAGITLDAPAAIDWMGDDIVDGAWVPQANKRYVVYIFWDGVRYRAVSQGQRIVV